MNVQKVGLRVLVLPAPIPHPKKSRISGPGPKEV